MYGQSPYAGYAGYPGYEPGQQQYEWRDHDMGAKSPYAGMDYSGAQAQPAYGYPAGGYGMQPAVQGAQTAGYPGTQSGGMFPYGSTGMMPQPGQAGPDVPGMLPLEQSYIENILRLNRGKQATVYMTFENNTEWNAKIFKGVIEAAGRDHLILSDPETGKRYLLLMIYLDYVTFDEELEYEYPFNGPAPGMASYTPR
ncbi:spore coat protein GerQ [Bacillus marinisedimentorum]|uniref:spore coat protein GerQ n=1 Tax=Bacillus marinisedimentorum TaxID=1821260 RepID=UPI003CCB7E2C